MTTTSYNGTLVDAGCAVHNTQQTQKGVDWNASSPFLVARGAGDENGSGAFSTFRGLKVTWGGGFSHGPVWTGSGV